MIVVLRWWFFVCCSLAATFVTYKLGLLGRLWAADVSHLSVIALTCTAAITLFIGWLTYLAANHYEERARSHLHVCWYASELMLCFGMMGTLIGFLFMLSSVFVGADITNTKAAQTLLTTMALGFSTAGVSTLIGLGCSFFIKLQLVNLEYLVPTEP